MERIKYIFCFIFLSIVCTSCHEGCDDSTYFNGKIRIIEDNSKAVKKVSLKNVILNGANFGYIAVYDSLMFFLNSDRKSTRLNSSHWLQSRMPSSA